MKLLIYFFFLKAVHVNCEMFSSTDELASLQKNQEIVIEKMEDLIEELEDGIELIKNKLSSIKSEQMKMIKDPQKYVENPLNSLLLIKSISIDVEEVQNTLNETLVEFTQEIINHRLPVSDFNGAIEGLLRIQKVYELKCEDLADGIINGVKSRDKLSSDELYAIGNILADLDEDFAEFYLKIALERSEGRIKNLILKKLLQIFELAGKHKKSLEIVEKMLEIDPQNELLENTRVDLELNLLFNEDDEDQSLEEEMIKNSLNQLSGTHKTPLKEKKILSQACMGKRLQNSSVISKLHCRYHSTNSFTKIAPFKLEIVNILPFVGIVHDVISNDEILAFKAFAAPKLHRAEVLSYESKGIVSTVRVAKYGFLYDIDDETKILAKVSRRVSDMSGLSIKTSEDWQVQNYGIGGHYNLHYDFAFEGQDFRLGTGNRILTALFYLSDVEMGGATVFPFLRLYVPPKKGAVVVWHNLSTSGHREYLTFHAACPVVKGSKWVANKWLHEFGQEFTRPCELHPMPTEGDFDQKYYIL